MLVRDIDVIASPMRGEFVRLRGEVVCDDPSVPQETFWLDVPASHGQYLTASGNSWLALLLPYALHLGEPLFISKPVDAELLSNAHELMRLWSAWYRRLHPVPIEADVAQPSQRREIGLTAAMFSGGVDAWFTLLSNNGQERHAGARHVDELLCVWGLDVPVSAPHEFTEMRNALSRSSSEFGAQLIELATNIRETHWWRRAGWGPVAHGACLASLALALEGRYSRILIPSWGRYDELSPWGSHPMTDPLLSTSNTRVVHDGAGYTRVEKTTALAKSDAALQSLQVCWETGSFQNCGHCAKCYRTMTTLYLLGALDRCPRFPSSSFDPASLTRVFSSSETGRALMYEVRDLAVQNHRNDIARLTERGVRNSRWIAGAFRFIEFLARQPVLWRLSKPLEWRLRARIIA